MEHGVGRGVALFASAPCIVGATYVDDVGNRIVVPVHLGARANEELKIDSFCGLHVAVVGQELSL